MRSHLALVAWVLTMAVSALAIHPLVCWLLAKFFARELTSEAEAILSEGG